MVLVMNNQIEKNLAESELFIKMYLFSRGHMELSQYLNG